MFRVIELIRDAVSLDVHDANFAYTPVNYEHLLLIKAGLPKGGLVVRAAAYLLHTVKSFLRLMSRRDLRWGETPSIVFFAVSKNQQDALQPAIGNMKNSCFVGMRGFGDKELPLFFAYFLSLFFLPLVILRYFRAPQDVRRSYYHALDLYWISYGYYLMARWLFNRNQPLCVVVANDHIIWTRLLIAAARAEDVPSVYIQHASVTERFPPLAFDYAFLEGMDAAEKYGSIGATQAQLFLVGIPRFDAFLHLINTSNRVRVVGVCTNLFDTVDQIRPFMERLSNEMGSLSFMLRPHPRDPRAEEWRAVASEYDWGYSDGRVEDAFRFLTAIDLAIAGESNILLEATLLNVFAIYYDFTGKQLDWYGFYRNALVECYRDHMALVQRLRELAVSKPDSRSRAKRYCATIGTEYDGRSTELIVELLEQISSERAPRTQDWQPVTTHYGLSIYQKG